MENLNDYDFEPINRKMRPFSEESFLNAYVNDCHESEPVGTQTEIVKVDLNKTKMHIVNT